MCIKYFFPLLLLTLFISACKKEGCTDPIATNFSEKAKKDNGSCSYPVKETGAVYLKLDHQWGSDANNVFHLNTTYNHPTTGDELRFTTFNYFISNIQLKKDDGTWWTMPDSYFLVNLSQDGSSMLKLENVPTGKFTEVSYLIGVDSTRNVSGAQTGALTTTSGMFWSWNTGYIMVKAEGTSPQSSNGNFKFHLGGFSGQYSILNTKTATFGAEQLNYTGQNQAMIHLSVDPSKLFTSLGSVSNLNTIMMIGANAKTMANDLIDDGVRFKAIHN